MIKMWSALVLAGVLSVVWGHGRVTDPPGRGTMWRNGYGTRPNYDDDGLNCGGYYHQHSVNGGRCGICGDPYDASLPRAHEIGGTYGSGIIVGRYDAGGILPVTVQITAHHRGYWVFKICDDPYSTEQDCFDANPVELEEGGTEYYPPTGGTYNLNYRVPEHLACDHCVLQWVYTAGNNWGTCGNGTSGLGCGAQETFGACSDISIAGTGLPTTVAQTTQPSTATPESGTTEPITTTTTTTTTTTAEPATTTTTPEPTTTTTTPEPTTTTTTTEPTTITTISEPTTTTTTPEPTTTTTTTEPTTTTTTPEPTTTTTTTEPSTTTTTPEPTTTSTTTEPTTSTAYKDLLVESLLDEPLNPNYFV